MIKRYKNSTRKINDKIRDKDMDMRTIGKEDILAIYHNEIDNNKHRFSIFR